MQYEHYGNWRAPLDIMQYPRMERVKYPKAGTRSVTQNTGQPGYTVGGFNFILFLEFH
jgi:hypothetical protein